MLQPMQIGHSDTVPVESTGHPCGQLRASERFSIGFLSWISQLNLLIGFLALNESCLASWCVSTSSNCMRNRRNPLLLCQRSRQASVLAAPFQFGKLKGFNCIHQHRQLADFCISSWFLCLLNRRFSMCQLHGATAVFDSARLPVDRTSRRWSFRSQVNKLEFLRTLYLRWLLVQFRRNIRVKTRTGIRLRIRLNISMNTRRKAAEIQLRESKRSVCKRESNCVHDGTH